MKRIGLYEMFECTWDELEDGEWIVSVDGRNFDGFCEFVEDEDENGEIVVEKVIMEWVDGCAERTLRGVQPKTIRFLREYTPLF